MSSKLAATISHDTMVVFCGKLQGMLDPTRFGPGPKSRCIEHGGRWLTPPEFEVASGKSKHYRWKTNIKTESGANFEDLIEKGTLKCCPKSCECIICEPCPEVSSDSKRYLNGCKDTDSDSGISIGSSSTNNKQQQQQKHQQPPQQAPQVTLLKTFTPSSLLPPQRPTMSPASSAAASSSNSLDYPSMVQEAIYSLTSGLTDCTNLNIMLYILNRHAPSEPVATVYTKVRTALAFLVRMGLVKSTEEDEDDEDDVQASNTNLPSDKIVNEEMETNDESRSPKKKSLSKVKETTPKAEESKVKGPKKSSGESDSSTKEKRPMVFRPKKLSPELASICGRKVMTRPDVVRRLWHYVRSKKLQDVTNKMIITCDDKLKAITKKKKINQNELFSILKNHMTDH